MPNVSILGLGTSVPQNFFRQTDSDQIAAQFYTGTDRNRKLLPALFRRTTVQKRHSVTLNASEGDLTQRQRLFAPAAHSSDLGPSTAERMQMFEDQASALAIQAAAAALEDAQVAPQDISHVVTVSCTGLAAPGFDIDLVQSLRLPPESSRTHIGFMGCHGALNGLRVADALARGESQSRVLLCATELCSLHYQYAADAEQIVANALFADGSAAMVLGCALPHQRNGQKDWRVVGTGTQLIENTREMMSWRVGNNGFEMTLSSRLPSLIQQKIRPWLESWLKPFGLTPNQIASWAAHPGGPGILNAFRQSMGLSRDDVAHSHKVLEQYGNMSSATLLFVLKELRQSAARLPCVAIGFGPGLTIESALFA